MTSGVLASAMWRRRDILYPRWPDMLRACHMPRVAAFLPRSAAARQQKRGVPAVARRARNLRKLEANPMLCRACQETLSGGRPRKIKGRAGDRVCSRCGRPLSFPPEDMVQRVRAKQLQLARFGLDAALRPLLERKLDTRSGRRGCAPPDSP